MCHEYWNGKKIGELTPSRKSQTGGWGFVKSMNEWVVNWTVSFAFSVGVTECVDFFYFDFDPITAKYYYTVWCQLGKLHFNFIKLEYNSIINFFFLIEYLEFCFIIYPHYVTIWIKNKTALASNLIWTISLSIALSLVLSFQTANN